MAQHKLSYYRQIANCTNYIPDAELSHTSSWFVDCNRFSVMYVIGIFHTYLENMVFSKINFQIFTFK